MQHLNDIPQPAFTCSKLTIETLKQGIFIVNFEHISQLVLVFPLLTLNMQLPADTAINV